MSKYPNLISVEVKLTKKLYPIQSLLSTKLF